MNITNADYFTFNVHNSALLVGHTGTGKSEFVRRYIRRLERAFSPNQMQYVIYDLKQCEFSPQFVDGSINDEGAKLEYLYTDVRIGTPEDMDYLEELALLATSRAKEDTSVPLIFIYIEECDLAAQYSDRFHSAVTTINKNALAANMKLIFSTSRPSVDIVPPDFIASFDLVLSGTLATEVDEKTLGVPGATKLELHQFIVKEQHSIKAAS